MYAARLINAIYHDEKFVTTASTLLEGEYGQEDICIGVPVILGRNGIEKIVDIELNEEEKALFEASAKAVRATNEALKEVGAL